MADGDCLIWPGAKNGKTSYGRVALPATIGVRRSNGQPTMVLVHRVALVHQLGRPLGDGLVVDHICRNRACSNAADHLREVTPRENTLAPGSLAPSAVAAGWTYCPSGHRLGGENRIPSIASRGWRSCRACQLARNSDSNAAISAAHKAVGIRRADYGALFGWSTATAEAINAAVAGGIEPAWVIRHAPIIRATRGVVLSDALTEGVA